MDGLRIRAVSGSCSFGMVGGILGVMLGVWLGQAHFREGPLLSQMGALGRFLADLMGLLVGATVGGVLGAIGGATVGTFVGTWNPQRKKQGQADDGPPENLPADGSTLDAEIARLRHEIDQLEQEKATLEARGSRRPGSTDQSG